MLRIAPLLLTLALIGCAENRDDQALITRDLIETPAQPSGLLTMPPSPALLATVGEAVPRYIDVELILCPPSEKDDAARVALCTDAGVGRHRDRIPEEDALTYAVGTWTGTRRHVVGIIDGIDGLVRRWDEIRTYRWDWGGLEAQLRHQTLSLDIGIPF